MLNPLSKNFACLHCRDEKHAATKKDDAQRIYNNILRLKNHIKNEGYDLDECYKNRLSLKTKNHTNISLQQAKTLCLSHQHCMCGFCTKVKNHIDDANRINCKISEDIIKIYYLLIQLKEEDNQQLYSYIKSTLRNVLNVDYSRAGHLIFRA